MKVAFVVQRYGLEINGGAELHCRWIAEHMKKYWEVEVLTTKALDYITWKNHYSQNEEVINGIKVRRFPVTRPRNPERFGRIQNYIFENDHTLEDELRWLEEEGPRVPSLIRYIKENEAKYDYFIFFSYRYYHSYWGIKTVPHKGLLVPTAEHDPVVYLRLFRDWFRLPRAFIYNSLEERKMIQAVSGNENVPGDVVGVGVEIPAGYSGESAAREENSLNPYLLYIGRIDENKGCRELFDFFLRFKTATPSPLRLALIGSTVLKIPSHPDITYLGFVPEEEKFSRLAQSLLLVMPSFYESLSMVTLEAWALAKPVLVNGRCEVLKGQCLRANGGLYYENYDEFRETLSLLIKDSKLREVLGKNGRAYFEKNYTWEVIEKKYLNIINLLEPHRRQ